jgi:hypothetical protein
MKKIVFLLAFVSIGIFANASNGGLIHLNPVKSIEQVKPIDEVKLYEEIGYEFKDEASYFTETTCVTVTMVCPDAGGGGGYATCTMCSTSPSTALNMATACASYYIIMFCEAP